MYWAFVSVLGAGSIRNLDPLREVMVWCLRMHWIAMVSRDVIHDRNHLHRLRRARAVPVLAVIAVVVVRPPQVNPEEGGMQNSAFGVASSGLSERGKTEILKVLSYHSKE